MLLFLLPKCGLAQQQLVIRRLVNLKYNERPSFKKEFNAKSPASFFYSLAPNSDSFYKANRVNKLEVNDTSGKHHFSLWFDRKGQLVQSLITDKDVIIREYFDSSFQSATTIIYEKDVIQSIDSVATNKHCYKNTDTTISVYSNTLYNYKVGKAINERNLELNNYYNQQEKGFDLNLDGVSFHLKAKGKRQFASNFQEGQLYKTREEYFSGCILKVKGRLIQKEYFDSQLLTHPFTKNLYSENCTIWFVSGEEKAEPFKKLTSHPRFEDFNTYPSQRSQYSEYSFLHYSKNEKHLMDTAFIHYYQPASEEEKNTCNYFDPLKPNERDFICPTVLIRGGYSNCRSLKPVSTPLFTIRYEYYKD